MVLVSSVIERITRPTPTREGRKAPAHRFGDLRVQALAGALAAMLFTVTGITNRSLRALMTGLLHRPYSMNQASYDLSRLARNGLITRVPGPNRYALTRDGLLFAHFYTKVYDHLFRAYGTRPAQRAAGTCRRAGHPRPARRRPHRPGPPPHSSLTSRHGPYSTAWPALACPPAGDAPSLHARLRTTVKDVTPKAPYAASGTSPGSSGPFGAVRLT